MIEEGNKILNENSELPWLFRRAFHFEVERVSQLEHSNAGYYRRSKMAIACAYRTLNIWESCPTVDAFGRQLLELSVDCLAGKEDLEKLKEESERFDTTVNNVMFSSEANIVPAYAGFSCLSAINTVVYDFDYSIEKEGEKEINPENWEACFNSSLALSGGALWENAKYDERARKSFWSWYINVVVRETWSPFKSPGLVMFNE